MSAGRWTSVLFLLVACSALLVGVSCARRQEVLVEGFGPDPKSIKRTVAVFTESKIYLVNPETGERIREKSVSVLRTAAGDRLNVVNTRLVILYEPGKAFGAPEGESLHEPGVMYFRDRKFGIPAQFKPGDEVVIYYSPGFVYAAMDRKSEVVLIELTRTPVSAVFTSFDASSRTLTAQVNGQRKTYTMPAAAGVRDLKPAVVGQQDRLDQRGFARGDRVLLVMTLDGKHVRVVMDEESHRRVAALLENFPIPPASEL